MANLGKFLTALDTQHLALKLTPRGRLLLTSSPDEPALDLDVAQRLTQQFERGTGFGLFYLGAREITRPLPPIFVYWRDFAARYVTALCSIPDVDHHLPESPVVPGDLAAFAACAPVMLGADYLTAEVLESLWGEIGTAFLEDFRGQNTTVSAFLRELHPGWNVVGRVFFHLAENRKDPDAPFAFMATYTDSLSAHGAARHVPLGGALREYAGAQNTPRLLSLLVPVQRAAAVCEWLNQLVKSGEIYHPLRWSQVEALQFLLDVPHLEQAGIVVRMQQTWPTGRPSRPMVKATVGTKRSSVIGLASLVDFRVEISLDGETLTDDEIRTILASTHGLAMIRGRWVHVDAKKLEQLLSRYQQIEQLANRKGLGFAEAMRLLAGVEFGDQEKTADHAEWGMVTAGPWFAETLKQLRTPSGTGGIDPGADLRATLRPYQKVGVRWLHLLSSLGLGACLADDMGLGKTIQILALLLVKKRERHGNTPKPSLLVAPASLLTNWEAEIFKFAPDLVVSIAHTSFLKDKTKTGIEQGVDLVITSYGALLRSSELSKAEWELVILDEAQAIKNPGTKQTKTTKTLKSRARIALTGTPIENRLGDLWSLFDFINPGLLGTASQFSQYAKRLTEKGGGSYGPLRELVRPYILRRQKTDKTIIQDLPDKTEVKAYCSLSKKQAALYEQSVDQVIAKIQQLSGIERRGWVLSLLLRLKQICNHPSQWLGDGKWEESDSGKWGRLRELCETIAEKQEKVLVFTQFKEMIDPLAGFLGQVFGQRGLILHGGTPVKQRRDLVRRFQEDETVPFFILSIKAGGTGLNLTTASHVIHFDRWWNPAVENQATDRAFRIGQTRNVLVHKFVCQGTVEEKIDQLIESKKQMSQELLEGGAEVNLTELSDEELVKLVALDVKTAIKG